MQVHLFKNKFESDGTRFKVYCPRQYKRIPHKFMMYQDGSISKNVAYQDICVEKFREAFKKEIVPRDLLATSLNQKTLVDTKIKFATTLIMSMECKMVIINCGNYFFI